MYMIVIVTLMVALIGAYAQIYTKQAVNAFARQSGMANAMLMWHSTAAGLASSLVTKTNITAAGCSLTPPLAGGGLPSFTQCANGFGSVYVSMPAGANPLCSGTQAAPCLPVLPTGYTQSYKFYSVSFQPTAGNYYVLTYLPPPPANSDSYSLGLLCLPGDAKGTLTACPSPHTQFPMTFATLYKQLTKSLLVSPLYYGTVTASGVLTTPSISVSGGTPTSLQYTIPSSADVPVGSIGFIAKISPCLSC